MLLEMSFSGAIMILAILAIRTAAIHKLPKRTFLVLWGMALLRLLAPFSIPSGVSVHSVLARQPYIGEMMEDTLSSVSLFICWSLLVNIVYALSKKLL